jgi:hypothetical protein
LHFGCLLLHSAFIPSFLPSFLHPG